MVAGPSGLSSFFFRNVIDRSACLCHSLYMDAANNNPTPTTEKNMTRSNELTIARLRNLYRAALAELAELTSVEEARDASKVIAEIMSNVAEDSDDCGFSQLSKWINEERDQTIGWSGRSLEVVRAQWATMAMRHNVEFVISAQEQFDGEEYIEQARRF